MPIYREDQCVQCGGIRVARSDLCGDCLVKALDRERRKKHVLQVIIDKRDLEVGCLRRQLEETLAYGFKQNQENVKLNQQVKRLVKHIGGGQNDGKDREAEDTAG